MADDWTQTVEANTSYSYRIRARGTSLTDWSDWTDDIFSSSEPEKSGLLLPPRFRQPAASMM